MRSITNSLRSDLDLEDMVSSFGTQHEFGDITWYPSQRKVLYKVDDRVTMNASGIGNIDFMGFRSTLTLELVLLRSSEETQELTRDADTKCTMAKLQVATLVNTGLGYKNNDVSFTSYPVIGSHHRLQASGGCLDSPRDALLSACPWDPRVKGEFFHQTTISIGLSNAKDFIIDVKMLRDMVPKGLCGVELYNGILMRYVKASSAYLGKQEDAIDVDITYYRSKDPMKPRLYEDVVEEIEQMALFKYGGLPHWGKNRNLAFDGVMRKYAMGGEFLKVKKNYDPMGLFSSEWTDQVLGINGGVSVVKEGCALEGLCICSQDIHCAPAKQYFCRPGKVYKDARVCTRI
ncbi:probable L-gulonolactone oxidase 6 isoform X2 [Amborella trichopoda]|nr:probable L-gulonolactone oxidase 6 isoform X2 [Amborella trichopoda]XP_020524197.1 probable L-gulonolactone oxidase 6 isoform X2 [Amborella trichopoda]|eukprot:XP_020524196.1 probable L-gulonolactone oxidase 6 isoform X2 [Amborella trichopoda]